MAEPSAESARREAPPPPDAAFAVRRIALAALAALLAINLYTGAPLLAIWVGSRTSSGVGLTMGTVGVVLGVLIATVVVLALALARVQARYDRLTGRERGRQTAPWMRSMRDEREEYIQARRELGGVDKAIIGAVVVAVIAFEIWFFFFSGSPIGSA